MNLSDFFTDLKGTFGYIMAFIFFKIWWTGSRSTQRKPPTCDDCINNQNTEEKKFYKNNICRSSEDLIYLSKLQNNTDAATIYGNWGSINKIIKSEIK